MQWVELKAPGVSAELKVQAFLLRIELLMGGFLQFTASGVCGIDLEVHATLGMEQRA
jgi:hypothetical protein